MILNILYHANTRNYSYLTHWILLKYIRYFYRVFTEELTFIRWEVYCITTQYTVLLVSISLIIVSN